MKTTKHTALLLLSAQARTVALPTLRSSCSDAHSAAGLRWSVRPGCRAGSPKSARCRGCLLAEGCRCCCRALLPPSGAKACSAGGEALGIRRLADLFIQSGI